MAVQVLEPAATWYLTSLERFKAEVGLDTAEDDEVIESMISRASQIIARECRRTFGLQKVQETLAGSGSVLLELSQVPIVAITEVLEDSAVVDSSEYFVEDADVGAVYRENGWGRTTALRAWGTEAYASGYILPGNASRMRYIVTYYGGYIMPGELNPYLPPDSPDDLRKDLPGDLEEACLETVKTWFDTRTGASAGTASSIGIGQLRVTYGANAAQQQTARQTLPPVALGILQNYKRVT